MDGRSPVSMSNGTSTSGARMPRPVCNPPVARQISWLLPDSSGCSGKAEERNSRAPGLVTSGSAGLAWLAAAPDHAGLKLYRLDHCTPDRGEPHHRRSDPCRLRSGADTVGAGILAALGGQP